MSRRWFVGVLALAGVACAVVNCPTSQVIVIGSGVSGLAVADTLQRFGCDVVVIEAQDHKGGRCLTVNGQDLGAHWIHGGKGNPILSSLVTELDIDTIVLGEGDPSYETVNGFGPVQVFDTDGTLVQQNVLESAMSRLDAIEEDKFEDQLDKFIDEGFVDPSVQDAIDAIVDERALTPLQNRSFVWAQSLVFEGEDGCSASQLSLRATVLDDFLSFEDSDGEREEVMVGGCSSLITKLSQNVVVHTSKPVTSIAENADSVTVTVQGGDTFTGSHVVVTASIGVLQANTISFTPEVSSGFADLLPQIELGNLMKVIIEFDTKFWSNDFYYFGYLSGVGADQGKFPYFVNANVEDANSKILVCLIGGRASRDLEDATDSEVEEQITSVIRTMFGDTTPAPTSITVARWTDKEFIRGTWSHVAVGGSADAMEELAGSFWDGKLLFSGEHTCRIMYGTLHAAYVSGLRSAAKILRLNPTNTGEDVWSMLKYRDWCEVLHDSAAVPFSLLWILPLTLSLMLRNLF